MSQRGCRERRSRLPRWRDTAITPAHPTPRRSPLIKNYGLERAGGWGLDSSDTTCLNDWGKCTCVMLVTCGRATFCRALHGENTGRVGRGIASLWEKRCGRKRHSNTSSVWRSSIPWSFSQFLSFSLRKGEKCRFSDQIWK